MKSIAVAPHTFKDQLQFSEECASAAWVEWVYKAAFPGFASRTRIPKDGWGQRSGIDCLIVLERGKTLHAEEKFRSEIWPDVALEYISNDRTGAPGWVAKESATDYLVYFWVPAKCCITLPMQTLRVVWEHMGEQWIRLAKAKRSGFFHVVAPNHGYNTLSVAVPVHVLREAVSNAMCLHWLDGYGHVMRGEQLELRLGGG